MLLNIFFASACGWLAPKRLSEVERREILTRFKAEIERAGGPQVWVKVSAYAAFPPARTDTPVEVLAVPAAFDGVFSAIKRQAEKESLETKIKETRSPDRWRSVEIRLSRGRAQVGQWRLREIRQLRRAAIVIDDLGQDLEAARRLLALPYPLTFSVLPYLRHSGETAEEAHRAGREVMLHWPMQPEPGSPIAPGKGEIKVGMPLGEVAQTLQADLASVPHAVGVNNHMGSRATSDAALMAEVMQVLAERHLYFVDSRTTGGSVALDAARRLGLPAFYRSVFLDDTETTAYSLGQLREFRRVVEEQGAALAIGHPHTTTLAALARFLPELERDDIQLVPASQLVRLPEVARLSPPRRAAEGSRQ